jgi:hypothetical protein
MLAELIEQAIEQINDKPSNWWSQYSPGTWVVPRPALDPSTAFEKQERSLLFLPIVTGYSMAETGRRERIKQLATQPTIQMVLSVPFDDFGIDDVSSWEKIKLILNFREELERAVLGMPGIIEVEPEPPMEVTYNIRWFLSTTDFIFQQNSCL